MCHITSKTLFIESQNHVLTFLFPEEYKSKESCRQREYLKMLLLKIVPAVTEELYQSDAFFNTVTASSISLLASVSGTLCLHNGKDTDIPKREQMWSKCQQIRRSWKRIMEVFKMNIHLAALIFSFFVSFRFYRLENTCGGSSLRLGVRVINTKTRTEMPEKIFFNL